MAHAPSRLVRNTELALQLFCGDAMARGREKIHRVKPLLERHAGASKRRPDHRVDVIPAVASVSRHFRKLPKLADFTAALANDVLTVTLLKQVRQTSVVGEPCEKLLDRYADGHSRLHVEHHAISYSIRQADNR